MRNFYTKKGIIDPKSYVETAEQNGRVERKHHQILNIVRILKF